MPDIKGMLDSIIDGANNKFPNTVNSTMHQNMGVKQPQTFDAGKFREKLSMYVLKDIISAMMHDETKDLDGMIDQSIMQHIRDEYGCGCYGYLCKARDKANPPSPLLSDIVQEVEDKTKQVTEKVAETQDDAFTQDVENMKDELPDIENYEELRKKLKDIVSRKVVDDVAKEITKSNAVPVFDDLDDKLAAKTTDTTDAEAETGDVAGEDVQSESVIMNICTTIITEAAAHRIDCTFEQGFNLAVIEYCMSEMDYLFKMDPTMTKIDKWQQPRPITESFFDRLVQEQEDPKHAAERERYAKMFADRKERIAKQNAEWEAKKTAKRDAENAANPKLAAERERYAKMFAKSKGVQPVKEEDEEYEEYSDDFF